MKWNIADLPIFAAVVEHQGISSAARALRMPKSSVSRFVQRLEDDLQVRLLDRNSRHVHTTAEGEVFYKHCKLILEQVEAADAHMNGITNQPNGLLTVSLPMAFSREIVAGHLHRFRNAYPDVELNIQITPNQVNLLGDHIDVAVQVGELPDSDLIAITLFETPLVWVASPAFLKTIAFPRSLEELTENVYICEQRYHNKPLTVRHGDQRHALNVGGEIETTDPIMVRDTVIAGAGIALLPYIYVRDQIAQGKLRQVGHDWAVEPLAKASAVYTSRRMLSARTRVFIDFLKTLTDEALAEK
ncbi:LysR family transcriptional regulator [Salinispirillum sp. LH 10-3-1]|uniref:LysR family transcriptional regulator n=1 Tax=Salinispirillum sp. LH 10-3-1 TaxID=2952525 RepID=A0AB38YH99_9GAMM